MTGNVPNTPNRSPVRLLAVLTVAIFLADLLVLLLLRWRAIDSLLVEALIDPLILTALISPVLYLFVFRPFTRQMAERERAAAALANSEAQTQIESLHRHNEREELIGAVVTLNDITEQKRTEDKLREKERLLSESQRLGHVGSWLYDMKGPMKWSEELYRLYGVSPDTFIPTTESLLSLIHPDDRPAMQTWLTTCAAGAKHELVFRIIRPDGELRFILGRGESFHDDGNQLIHMAGTAQDITERKQAENALQAKNKELEQFTYAVSHDLRSPLVTIQTFLGHLEEDMATADAGRIAKDVNFIHTAANKMDALLKNLGELSRVGRQIYTPEDVSLPAIVKEALAVVAGRISQRGVQVVVTETPAMLHGDHTRLVSVFQNLVDNACKFMGDQKDPRIEIGVETHDTELVYFVRDNGSGIEPSQQDKLFGLFVRLNPQVEGTGIGLALVRRIIEVHGGRIWVESKGIGQGACFYFTLPGLVKKTNEGEKS